MKKSSLTARKPPYYLSLAGKRRLLTVWFLPLAYPIFVLWFGHKTMRIWQ